MIFMLNQLERLAPSTYNSQFSEISFLRLVLVACQREGYVLMCTVLMGKGSHPDENPHSIYLSYKNQSNWKLENTCEIELRFWTPNGVMVTFTQNHNIFSLKSKLCFLICVGLSATLMRDNGIGLVRPCVPNTISRVPRIRFYWFLHKATSWWGLKNVPSRFLRNLKKWPLFGQNFRFSDIFSKLHIRIV